MDFIQRKNLRLKGYDYSQNGAYFITICSADNLNIFSKIYVTRRDRARPCPKLKLTRLGELCENAITETAQKFSVSITDYVIMPNHIHLIIVIDNDLRTGASPVPTVSNIIRFYKSTIANEWLKICKEENRIMGKIWERSFYDHIIRDDEDYYIKARYIEENPLRWCLKNNLL